MSGPKSIPAAGQESAKAADTAPSSTESAPTSVSEDTGSSADAPDTEIVNTAIHPDNLPDQTSGTVTDPDTLRRHGLSADDGDEMDDDETPETPAPAAEGEGPLWQCYTNNLPSPNCPQFHSTSHLQLVPQHVECPNCGSHIVRLVSE